MDGAREIHPQRGRGHLIRDRKSPQSEAGGKIQISAIYRYRAVPYGVKMIA